VKGRAFSPAHLTGFFKAELDHEKSIEYQGSLGAGFSIQNGVTTTVDVRKLKKEDNSCFKIKISGYKTENTQVSEFVLKKFLKITNENYFLNVHHEITVPIGYGLGSSGAVALSLGLALNQALNTGLSSTQIGKIAHAAEISCQTGLGDVLASFHGGFEIRTKSGAPGIGTIQKIKTDNSTNAIMICFAPISTKKFMKEKMASINGLGGKMVNKLCKTKDRNQFQDMSIEFAKYIKVITPKMNTVIDELHRNGIRCGVALFGETVFTLIPNEMEDKVFGILKKYNGVVIKSQIDNSGARLA